VSHSLAGRATEGYPSVIQLIANRCHFKKGMEYQMLKRALMASLVALALASVVNGCQPEEQKPAETGTETSATESTTTESTTTESTDSATAESTPSAESTDSAPAPAEEATN